MGRAKPILMKILEKQAHGWFPEFREKVIFELKTKNLSSSELEHEANKRISAAYVSKVCEAILDSEDLAQIGPGISRLLTDQVRHRVQMHTIDYTKPVIMQVRAGVIYQEALEATEQILNKRQAEEERWLKEQFPIRSRIHSWLTSRLLKRKTENILANQWTAHSLALDACKKAGLTQHAYFLSRDLSFLQVRQEQCTIVQLQKTGYSRTKSQC